MSDKKFYTLHELVDILTEELNLTPEQQFRVTAKIKRLVHFEKASVFHRYFTYSQGAPLFEGEGENRKCTGHAPAEDEFLHGILEEKYKQHDAMAREYTDEELVTWDIGTHKFRQEKPPCADCECAVDNTTGYLTTYTDGESITFCRPCAEKNGAWKKAHEDE